MSNTDTPAAGGAEDRGFFGHPRGLSVLFFSELWERFSFYGMRALLTLYMVKELGYPKDTKAYGIYGAYGALVYAFPVIGGWIANKWLGYRRSIVLGGTLMALGHFAMAIPALEDLGMEVPVEQSFFAALALLCLGNGFFKPNISSTVGRLYPEGDLRRDRGFTIFYMGINIGALLAPLVCGQFQGINWHIGFSLAGVGMVIGLVWFLIGRRHIGEHGEPDDRELLSRPLLGPLNRLHLVVLGSFAAVPLVAYTLYEYEVAETIIQVVSVGVLFVLIGFAVRLEGVARLRMVALMILMFFHMLFWGGFEQAGSSFNVLTDEHVRRSVGAWDIEAAQYQAVNPAMIVLLAPLFSMLWKVLQRVGWDPSIPMKFALGLIQLGLGFLVLIAGIRAADDFATVGLAALVFCYLLHTTGELCLSPVGLSAVTKLAPRRWVGFCMGAWFLTIANAHLIAAGIAQLTAAGDAEEPTAAVSVEPERRAEIAEWLTREAPAPALPATAERYEISADEIIGWNETRRAALTAVAKSFTRDEETGKVEEGSRDSREIADGRAQAEVAERLGIDVELIHEWRRESLRKYEATFFWVAVVAILAGVFLAAVSPLMRRFLLQGVQ